MDTLFALLLAAMLSGRQFVQTPEVNAYFSGKAEINFLCAVALHQAPPFRGCYVQVSPPMVYVVQGDVEALRHELRHHFEGAFHP
jgi:hypothetical protein